MARESVLPYFWMLLGSLSFAVMGTLAHGLASACDWQLIAMVRVGICLVLTAAWAKYAGAKLVFWRPRTLWIRSMAGSVSLICTFFALSRLPVPDVLTLTNTFPIWVALLAWPLLGEVPGLAVWLSVASGMAGVVLVQQPHFSEGNFISLLALASSFFTAIAMLGLHRLHTVDIRAVVVHFSAVSMVFCVAALLLFEHDTDLIHKREFSTFVMLLGVGVTATIGQLLLTKAFTSGAPSRVSVVGLSQIVFAMLFDLLLFGRKFDLPTLLGICLVLAPTGWLMLHERLRRPIEEESLVPVEEETPGPG